MTDWDAELDALVAEMELAERLDAQRADEAFHARLRTLIERYRAILEGLEGERP